MITVEDARAIVFADVRKHTGAPEKYVICHEQEFEKGWCFVVQSRKFIEENDRSAMVIGAGPIVVDRYTGDIHFYSSVCSCDGAVYIYNKTGKSGLVIENAIHAELKSAFPSAYPDMDCDA